MSLNFLKKFLYLGPNINLSDLSNSKLLSNVLTAIESNINSQKSTELLQILINYFNFYNNIHLKNSITNRLRSNTECVSFFLACCARKSKDEDFSHKIYELLVEFSETPAHLFAFEHFWSIVLQLDKNKSLAEPNQDQMAVDQPKCSKHIGRGHKKALIKWFNSKSELELAKLVTQYRHMYNWTMKDILKLIHMKPKNEGYDLIMRYILFGYQKIESERLTGYMNLMEYIHDFEKLKFAKMPQEAVDIIKKHKLYLEHIPSKIFKFKEIWPCLIEQMNIEEFYVNLHQILKKEIIRPNSSIEKFIFEKILNRENPDYARTSPIANCLASQIIEHFITITKMKESRPRSITSASEDKSVIENLRVFFWNAFKNSIQLNKSQSISYFNLKKIMIVVEINPQMRNTTTLGLNYLNPLETSSAILLNLYYLNTHPNNVDLFVASDRLTRVELATNNSESEPNLGTIEHILQGFVSIEKNPTEKIFEWTLKNKKFYDVFVFLVSSDQGYKKIQFEMDFVRANTIAKDTKLIVVNLTGKQTEPETEIVSKSNLDLYINGWTFETHFILESFLKGDF